MAKKRGGRKGKSDQPPKRAEMVRGNPQSSQESFADFRTGIAARLKLLRDKQFPDQTAGLAARIGITRRRFDDWLAGKSAPTGEALAMAAIATGCSVEWLVLGEGVPFPTVQPESTEGRQRLRTTHEELLVVVDHLGLALEAMGPMLDEAERDQIVAALASLAPRFKGQKES